GVGEAEAGDEIGALARLANDRFLHATSSGLRCAKYAAHAPSLDTIVAPSGVSGVQSLPNAGHSHGFFTPRSTSPLIQRAGSRVAIAPTSNTCSASCARYGAAMR